MIFGREHYVFLSFCDGLFFLVVPSVNTPAMCVWPWPVCVPVMFLCLDSHWDFYFQLALLLFLCRRFSPRRIKSFSDLQNTSF